LSIPYFSESETLGVVGEATQDRNVMEELEDETSSFISDSSCVIEPSTSEDESSLPYTNAADQVPEYDHGPVSLRRTSPGLSQTKKVMPSLNKPFTSSSSDSSGFSWSDDQD
jgi:hypothetical protein